MTGRAHGLWAEGHRRSITFSRLLGRLRLYETRIRVVRCYFLARRRRRGGALEARARPHGRMAAGNRQSITGHRGHEGGDRQDGDRLRDQQGGGRDSSSPQGLQMTPPKKRIKYVMKGII